jgi:hypothetical protein
MTYEAGYDGFWLARLLKLRGVDCRVMDPASLQVDRRARRVKTDRIDVEKLLHALIAWCRGERHVCSMVVIPSAEEEDLRRSHRERRRLVRERTASSSASTPAPAPRHRSTRCCATDRATLGAPDGRAAMWEWRGFSDSGSRSCLRPALLPRRTPRRR